MIASIGELLVEFVCVDMDTHHLSPAPYIGPFPSGAPGIFIDQVARIARKAICPSMPAFGSQQWLM